MKQKWDEDWNQSLNQMTRMRLEEHKGTCDFAFPEGDLAYGGQEGICPTVHGEEGGGSREEQRPVGPVDATQVFPYLASDLK